MQAATLAMRRARNGEEPNDEEAKTCGHSRRDTRTRSCRLADKFVSCADGAMRVRDAIARAQVTYARDR
jgi:hypothetical protein